LAGRKEIDNTMTPIAHPGINNHHTADIDDSINPDKHEEWMLSDQTIMIHKLIMLPHRPKSNDVRRELHGMMCENNKSRRLKLGWILWILSRCRKFMRENIEDLICGRALKVGLREGGVYWFLVMFTGIIQTCD
jgi:hypothetical protein